MPEINVLFAEDLSLVAKLEKDLFSDPWSEASLTSFAGEKTSLLLLARQDGKAVGYLVASVLAPEGELLRIATLPSHRGRGVAKALMAFFLEESRKRGSDTLFLEVRASNRAARSLYEAFGFRVIGERKHYYRLPTEDAVLYQYTGNCEEMQ